MGWNMMIRGQPARSWCQDSPLEAAKLRGCDRCADGGDGCQRGGGSADRGRAHVKGGRQRGMPGGASSRHGNSTLRSCQPALGERGILNVGEAA